MPEHAAAERTLTEWRITDALWAVASSAQAGREARPRSGPCDHMYDKGWDDCLRIVRGQLLLALAQASPR